jgi:hypothetical protein
MQNEKQPILLIFMPKDSNWACQLIQRPEATSHHILTSSCGSFDEEKPPSRKALSTKNSEEILSFLENHSDFYNPTDLLLAESIAY